jgi:A/G-specific adenine glycosylase
LSRNPFSDRVISWQREHGRNNLPWQGTRDAYRIWLSEVMLQQTQVQTVIPYYERFLARFPTVVDLANAHEDTVMELWSGLGYYSRARNLHRAAKMVRDELGGVFPTSSAVLENLSGVGRSTAAAIAAFSSDEQAAILDGNVKRVLSRHAGIARSGSEQSWVDLLWPIAQERLPLKRTKATTTDEVSPIVRYTQGMMDLGATVCTLRKPICAQCPVSADCVALKSGSVEDYPGSKARKHTPQRFCDVFVFYRRHEGQVEYLFHKRPPAGIWPLLWSFPHTLFSDDSLSDDVTAVALRAREQLKAHWPVKRGARIAPQSLCEINHTFTHFKLTLRAWLIETSAAGASKVADDSSTRWRTKEQSDFGLPVPMQKILTYL